MLRHPDAQIQSILAHIDEADRDWRYGEMLDAIHELEQVSTEKHDIAGRAAVLYYLACHKHLLNQKQEALRLALDAVKFCQENRLDYYEMHAHNICGIIYEDTSDYSSCLDHYLTAFDLAMRTGEEAYAPYLLSNIGNLFMVMDDFENALVYMINGAQGFLHNPTPSAADLRNTSTAVLNIIEAYIGNENYVQALQWSTEHNERLVEYNKAGIAECFLILGRARASLRTGDTERAEQELLPLLDDAICPENFSDYYTINILLSAFGLAIDIGSQTLAAEVLELLDQARSATGLNTFDYKLEAERIRYYDVFFTDDEDYHRAKKYFYPYYQISCASHQQLSRTYANSLHMRTELDRVVAERESVRELNAELRRSIDLDPFTGIYNKISTRAHVENQLSHWHKGQFGAFMILDIDNFKLVNDTYGHQVGDRVIEGIADLMKNTFRRDDVVGRLGGDEFGIFLTATSETAILAKVDSLLKCVREFRVAEQPLCSVTLSVGICILHTPEDYENILARADQALYTSKQTGRDRYTLAQ